MTDRASDRVIQPQQDAVTPASCAEAAVIPISNSEDRKGQ